MSQAQRTSPKYTYNMWTWQQCKSLLLEVTFQTVILISSKIAESKPVGQNIAMVTNYHGVKRITPKMKIMPLNTRPHVIPNH